MNRLLKWGLIAVGSLFAAMVLAILLIPAVVDVNQYKPLIEKQATEALGRPVTLAGDLNLSVFPWVGFSVSGLSVANPEGFDQSHFIAVKSFEARVRLMPLLRRDVQVGRIVLNGPRIALEKNKAGLGNWEGLGGSDAAVAEPEEKKADEEAALPIKNLLVDELAITDGTVFWTDAATGDRKTVTELTVNVRDVSFDRPVALSLSAKIDQHPLGLEGHIGPVGKSPGRGTIPVEIAVSALEQIRVALKGQVENPAEALRFDLSAEVAPFSPRKAVAALGHPFPVTTTDPKALDHLGFRAQVNGGLKEIAVSDGVLEVDQSEITFSVRSQDLTQPDLAFDLNLDAIDLGRYLPPSAAKKDASAPATAGQSPAAPSSGSDYALLQNLVLDGRIRVGSLRLAQADIRDLDLKLTGKQGVFDVALSARKGGELIDLRANLGPVKKTAVPLTLSLKAFNQLNLALKGQVRRPDTRPEILMNIKVDAFSPRKLMAALGQEFPVATADPATLNRVFLKADIRGSAETLSVSDGLLGLDSSALTFSGQARSFSPPDVRFSLDLDKIDADRYLPPPAPASGKASPTDKPADTKPADYAPLRRLTVDGSARVGSLKIANARLQNLRLKISGKNGTFRLDPLSVNLYRGNISIKGGTDFRQDRPLTDLNLTARNIAMGPLLRDTLQKDFLEGNAAAQMVLTLKGVRADEIRRTLNGNGNLAFTDGTIRGVNLAAMAQNAEQAFALLGRESAYTARTDFSEFKGVFKVESGRADVSDISLNAPVLQAKGGGTAHLAEETLNFRLTPTFVSPVVRKGKNRVPISFMVPVMVGGTFAKPTFRPDIGGMIRMIPQKTVDEIIRDPKKGVEDLLKQQKDKLKDFLKPSAEDEEKETSEQEKSGQKADQSESPEEAIIDIIKKLPFGQ